MLCTLLSFLILEMPFTFYHFGHSFPRRLYNNLQSSHHSVEEALNLPESCSIQIEGHSGLTVRKLLENPERYISNLRRYHSSHPIDVLSIDIGTNDLCDPACTVVMLLESIVQLIKLLLHQGVRPKFLIFMSIIQRTSITRQNQVSVNCFNHRAKKFNRSLKVVVNSYSWISTFHQNKVNFPKYICSDGCHLTPEGLNKYGRSLRQLILKYKGNLERFN